jgi:hypothetical protein
VLFRSRANQPETISIFDLFSSIITGEFFQGSQISIDDAEGITTGAEGPVSDLVVRTTTKHGFGLNTPFYFLNLNSTVSQEFESQNSTSVSFDPTNAATALSFDGSNTLLQSPIDLSNSATTSVSQSVITGVDISENTITVALSGEDWSGLSVGDPLYYSVTVASGFFNQNPRGVVFIKNTDGIQSNTATFQVTQLPDGDSIDITSNITGFFQLADQARTFAGNNIDENTQIDIETFVGEELFFDGSNTGVVGDPEGEDFVEENTEATVIGYSGSNITIGSSEPFLDFYVDAMLKYETETTAATPLVNGATYFVVAFQPSVTTGLFTIAIAEQPGGTAINFTSTGSGTQTFSRIGLSVDKDIVHVRNADFEIGDMLEYSSPNIGAFSYETNDIKRFFFVNEKFDVHNFKLRDGLRIRFLGDEEDNPALSAQQVRQSYLEAFGEEPEDGPYWLNPPGSSTTFQAYCRFQWNLNGGATADWVLILKVFNQGDMPSGSPLWRNTTLVNQNDFNLTSGPFAKYEAWNEVPFNRIAMEMTENNTPRVPPVMVFNTTRTFAQAVAFAGAATTQNNTLKANATEPARGNTRNYFNLPMALGANFANVGGGETVLQAYGIGMWTNNSTNSTNAVGNLPSTGIAGAWVGSSMDEGGHTFNNNANSGSDSGFGFGATAGNPAKTTSAGWASWAQSNSINRMPGYLWVR